MKFIRSISLVLLCFAFVPSLALGQSPGELVWKFQTRKEIESSPAIDFDGNIYFGSNDYHLYSVKPDGKLNWKFKTRNQVRSSPAIANDGTVYVGSDDRYLYAINKEGKLNWKFRTKGEVFSSPSIGYKGTIYVGSFDNYLYAISKKGKVEWRFKATGRIYSSPAIDKNGTIYFGSDFAKFYALNPDGTKKWDLKLSSVKFGAPPGIESSPAIDSAGIVYIGSDKSLWAINQNGSIIWEREIYDDSILPTFSINSPAIGDDGCIYTGAFETINNDFFAIKLDGKKRWDLRIGINVGYSTPLYGSDGTTYIGTSPGFIYAIDKDGTKKQLHRAIGGTNNSSPVMDKNGVIYVGSSDWRLYAIKTNDTPNKNAPWPMFGQNPQRTGRALLPVADKIKITSFNSHAAPFSLTFETESDSTYVIEASHDLQKWSEIGEVQGNGSSVKFIELRKALFPKQYYRVKLVE